jgi:predicted transglutaminase-like cysteine proteinase
MCSVFLARGSERVALAAMAIVTCVAIAPGFTAAVRADPAQPIPPQSRSASNTAEPGLPDRADLRGVAPDPMERGVVDWGGSDAEPFGIVTAPAASPTLWATWHGVREDIDSNRRLLERCRADLEHCGSSGAKLILGIVAAARGQAGRARLGQINRAINLAVRPVSDLALYGTADRWAAPLDTLTLGAGDCEDYAIAKYFDLQLADVPEHDLRLLIVHDLRVHQDHAVLAVRQDGHWLILDNRRLLMLEAAQLQDYVPVIMIRDERVGAVVGIELPATPAVAPGTIDK